MKFLFDFFPILLFFVAYKFFDIYTATAVAIAASFIQVGWFWLQHRRVEKMLIITLVMVTVLGGATLIFQDETFIKWKPSVVNWLFGIAFLGSQFIGKKPIIQRMMEASIEMPEKVWFHLNSAWSIFFIAMGFLNLYVAYNFDTDTWVNFKMFGMIGLTFLFIIGQGFFIGRYVKSEPAAANSDEKES
jgi:intracellular septation protein